MPAVNASRIVEELRAAVDELIEPSIALLRRSEADSDEDCFSTPAGQHLRYRCCVYFSSLAGALLEWRFGVHEDTGPVAWHSTVPPLLPSMASRAPSAYGALARWLLHPPPLAPAHEVARADALIAAADAAGPDYRIRDVRQAASQLAGPLGKYVSRLRVGGARGTLWRCEASTAHTYLVFEPDGGSGEADDVFVDVSYKQFLVMPELMGAADFARAQAVQLFADEPDGFVGRAAELRAKMTLDGLRDAFRRIEAGRAATPSGRLSARPDLAHMVSLRNDGIFALHDRRRRKELCGRPWQTAGPG